MFNTHTRLELFVHRHAFPGWYIDVSGCYCCMLGRYLISIFVNSCDDTLDITVDTVGSLGYFDTNIEWETPQSESELVNTARRYVREYSSKI